MKRGQSIIATPITGALAIACALAAVAVAYGQKPGQHAPLRPKTAAVSPVGPKVRKSDAEWRRILPSASYEVLRQQGTEAPGSGKYEHSKGSGIYRCIACGNELFRSDTQFDSGTGWPSFWAPIAKDHVLTRADDSDGARRTEVICARCGGHLGHVFDDGPRPTGLRYCMNSVALKFVARPAK
jgi:peptide-methionine (R)-S-oxide reductase